MKKWYLSKTLWLNIIGLALVITETVGGYNWVKPEIIAGALGVLNFALRLVSSTKLSK